jgi:peptide/nickel transport system substrate-binding protein
MKMKIAVLLSILLLTCSTAVLAGEVKNPDTLIEALALNQESLDPYFQYDITSNEVCKNVYENLLAWVGESVTEIKPHLSLEIPSKENGLVSADGRTYTFPIRKNVKFHAGGDLTPADIEYTYERAMVFDRAGGPSWMILEPLTGYSTIESIVEAEGGVAYQKMFDTDGNLLDPKHKDILVKVYEKYVDPAVSVDGDNLVITLKEPYAPFISELPQGAGWFSILDKEWSIEQGAWDGKADTWWNFHDPKAEKDPLFDKMNGTGPYKLVKWDNGVEVVLERFDAYWGEKPQAKHVKILTMPEWSTRKAALLAGDVDMAIVDPQYLSQVEGQPGIRVHKQLDQLSVYMLFFNQTIKVEGGNRYVGSGKLDGDGVPPDFFADIHVRKAFSHLYDDSVIINDVQGGNAIAAYGPVVKPLLGYTAKEPGYNYSLEKAEAEFKKAFGGKLWEKGFKMVAAYATGRMVDKAVLDMITYNARKINPKFKIESQSFAWSTLLSDYLNGVYPMWILEWNADYPDPHNMAYPILHPTGFYGSALGAAYHEWANKELAPLLDQGVSEFDPAKREALYQEICKRAEDNAVIVFLYQPTRVHVEREWVRGWFNNAITESAGRHFYLLEKSAN